MSQDERNGFDDAALEALFAEARDEKPAPLEDGFSARLLAQAEGRMPKRQGRDGWWSRLRTALAEIGGAPGLAGVGVAGLAGVWIGFSGPGQTGEWVDRFWQGAASVSGPVSSLVEGDPLSGAAGDALLSLMSASD